MVCTVWVVVGWWWLSPRREGKVADLSQVAGREGAQRDGVGVGSGSGLGLGVAVLLTTYYLLLTTHYSLLTWRSMSSASSASLGTQPLMAATRSPALG